MALLRRIIARLTGRTLERELEHPHAFRVNAGTAHERVIARYGWPLPALAGGAPDDDEGDEGDGDEGDEAAAASAGSGGDDELTPPDGDDVEAWRAYSRKWEQRAKRTPRKLTRERREAVQRAEAAEARLAELEGASQSEQERAVKAARDEALAEARAEAEAGRRRDRLEVAVTRVGARMFADVDDALLNVERMIDRGDVDPDDVYDDDGKIKTDGVRAALEQLLEDKPHLALDRGSSNGGTGANDAGKGGAAKGRDGMTPAEHLESIRRHK